ncbi:OsmC family protein [Sphingobacterium sp. SYP-B4668]|uniref:OsmC family protein n=1 Tax=Sphingobacterium sp. SYP-B4668 TaxID=2996035 RepID=UPI0022DE4A10|nr:OsmC family protein [Sphingobacterium sp. SYP-B4668]
MKYILEEPLRGTIGLQKYKTTMYWRNGQFVTDEPQKLGGEDLGPDPYTLLLASLVGCTLATLKMYIDHKDLNILAISVEANLYHKIVNQDVVTYIERTINFKDFPDVALHQRLLRVAENCPVSKLLKGSILISTKIS